MSLEKILTYPGNGVHTVNTGRERKEKIFQAYYQTTELSEVEQKWKEELNLKEDQNIWLLGAPSDCGAGIMRGSNWGPLAIREALLEIKEDRFLDLGDIRVVPHLLHDKYLNNETIESVQRALYNGEKLPVSPLSLLEFAGDELFKSNAHLLSLGGDHSISFPLTKSWLKYNTDKIGILHFDAHTDLLKQRLGIDYCFGSWASHTIELMQDSQNFVQVGIRSTGKDRNHWESSFNIQQIWSEEVRQQGANHIGEQIRKHFQKQGVEKIYLSFDIDVFDIEYASATGTPEAGGLQPSDALLILSEVAKELKIQSADLVEVAPFVQYPDRYLKNLEPKTTLDSALGIITFLMDHWNES